MTQVDARWHNCVDAETQKRCACLSGRSAAEERHGERTLPVSLQFVHFKLLVHRVLGRSQIFRWHWCCGACQSSTGAWVQRTSGSLCGMVWQQLPAWYYSLFLEVKKLFLPTDTTKKCQPQSVIQNLLSSSTWFSWLCELKYPYSSFKTWFLCWGCANSSSWTPKWANLIYFKILKKTAFNGIGLTLKSPHNSTTML